MRMSRIAWFFLVCVPPLSAALLVADGRPPLTKEAPADEDEDQEEDGARPEEEHPAARTPKPLDPEVYNLLADPLRTPSRSGQESPSRRRL